MMHCAAAVLSDYRYVPQRDAGHDG
jgi:hypothetical protein